MKPSQKSILRTALILCTIIAMTAILIAFYHQKERANQGESAATFPAAKGPLAITIEEGGTIHPREQIILKSEVEGRARILFLIPEGTLVQEGDLLVELDASNLVEQRLDLEIESQNAEAAFIRSRENLEVVKNQAKSDEESARLKLQFAEEDLIQYREGEYPNSVKEQEAKITLTREELQRARDKLEWSEVLLKEQYLAESEVRADALAVRKAELDVELAENNFRFLKDFEYKRKINQLESDFKQAEMALERTQRKVKADVIQAEAELRAKDAAYQQHVARLKRLNEQIEKAKIVAPRDGLVIYATSTQFRWRGNDEPLAEGQEIRERQELIHLPTAAGFLARISVHESSVQKVQTGQAATITVNARRGSSFTGSVDKIAPLPDPTSAFMNPDLKLYDTEVLVDGGLDVLKAGMSCQVSILITNLQDAVYVPVHTVLQHQGKPTVFLPSPDGPVARQVQVGKDNGRMVHIKEGLAEGETVMLAPPIGRKTMSASASRKQRKRKSQN